MNLHRTGAAQSVWGAPIQISATTICFADNTGQELLQSATLHKKTASVVSCP